MPARQMLLDEEGNPIKEKTWPLNLEQKRPKPIDLSVVSPKLLE